MATTLSIRFYYQESPDCGELLSETIEALSQWSGATNQWNSWRVCKGNRHGRIEENKEALGASELTRKSLQWRGSDLLLTATTALKCWRFEGLDARHSSIAAWVETWGQEWAANNIGDPLLVGCGAITISSAGPYCAILDADGVSEVNRKVEENLDEFTQLIFCLISRLRPSALRVYTDEGLYLPFNAHLLYTRNPTVIVDDINHLAQIWKNGLPIHGVPSFLQYSAREHAAALHEWRDEGSRYKLWWQLNSLISRAGEVSGDDVTQTLKSGQFDTYDAPVGDVVLDYPYFLNAFLDRLYVGALRSIAGDAKVPGGQHNV